MDQKTTRGRGRPSKNGLLDGGEFVRDMAGTHCYQVSRSQGEKHESALAVAADRVGCSAALIRRILARWRPKGADRVLTTLAAPPLTEAEIALFTDPEIIRFAKRLAKKAGIVPPPPEQFWRNATWMWIGTGPAPTYPRHNARRSVSENQVD